MATEVSNKDNSKIDRSRYVNMTKRERERYIISRKIMIICILFERSNLFALGFPILILILERTKTRGFQCPRCMQYSEDISASLVQLF